MQAFSKITGISSSRISRLGHAGLNLFTTKRVLNMVFKTEKHPSLFTQEMIDAFPPYLQDMIDTSDPEAASYRQDTARALGAHIALQALEITLHQDPYPTEQTQRDILKAYHAFIADEFSLEDAKTQIQKLLNVRETTPAASPEQVQGITPSYTESSPASPIAPTPYFNGPFIQVREPSEESSDDSLIAVFGLSMNPHP